MKRRQQFRLVDETGKPLSPHIAAVLVSLVPRLQREFSMIRDHSLLMDLLEEAGRRIVKRELRLGPIEHLHGYAWVALRSVANSWLRRGSSRLALNTLTSDESGPLLDAMATSAGSPEQIERAILWREVLALLTREERLVCTRRELGFSSREIAKLRGSSAGAVDTLLSRAKDKLRGLLGVSAGDQRHDMSAGKRERERSDPTVREGSDFGNFDDE